MDIFLSNLFPLFPILLIVRDVEGQILQQSTYHPLYESESSFLEGSSPHLPQGFHPTLRLKGVHSERLPDYRSGPCGDNQSMPSSREIPEHRSIGSTGDTDTSYNGNKDFTTRLPPMKESGASAPTTPGTTATFVIITTAYSRGYVCRGIVFLRRPFSEMPHSYEWRWKNLETFPYTFWFQLFLWKE